MIELVWVFCVLCLRVHGAGAGPLDQGDNSGVIKFPESTNGQPYVTHHHRNRTGNYPRRRRPEAPFFSSEDNVPGQQVPLDFIKHLNDYQLDNLLTNFVEYDEQDTSILASRFGEAEERNAAVMPKEAGCEPEMQTVELVANKDPTVIYIPQCTRVERCGGCCRHELLSCQPVPNKIEILNYQVYKTQYSNGRRKLKFLDKELVLVERHTKCECGCKVKEEDCSEIQEYRQAECRCVCRNLEDKKKCEKRHAVSFWNPDLCMCQCRNVTQCSTGYNYDHVECKCTPVSLNKRRFANYYTIS